MFRKLWCIRTSKKGRSWSSADILRRRVGWIFCSFVQTSFMNSP